ncbi:MAG: SpoIIIAH-like family protein [Clostridia bacterium]|nr:SpoIIIAH-like family protein [Clostridia bacterium]
MSLFVKKKQVVAATLIIALGAAVTVNWFFNNKNLTVNENEGFTEYSEGGNLGDSILVAGTVEFTESNPELVETVDNTYFVQAKLKRNETNDEILDLIDELTEKENLSALDITKLSNSFEEYKTAVKCQTDAENLIYAKTGNECLVIINGGSCQVIMQKNTLNDTVIFQITEIIEKNTNISAENLSIIEIK